MTDKNLLRTEIRRQCRSYSTMHVMEMSVCISERIIALPEYQKAQRVFCYHALPMEVQTGGLIREMLRVGKQVYLPVTRADRAMEAVRLRDAEAVHRAAYGIMEPDGDDAAEPETMDLILVPGMAFDRAGRRLGRGGGYFDAFLPRCRGLIVGVTFERQLLDQVPVEEHDWLMDRIITEQAVYDCLANRI